MHPWFRNTGQYRRLRLTKNAQPFNRRPLDRNLVARFDHPYVLNDINRFAPSEVRGGMAGAKIGLMHLGTSPGIVVRRTFDRRR